MVTVSSRSDKLPGNVLKRRALAWAPTLAIGLMLTGCQPSPAPSPSSTSSASSSPTTSSSSPTTSASPSASAKPSSKLTAAQTQFFLAAQTKLRSVLGFQLTPLVKLPGATIKSNIALDPHSQSWRGTITTKDYTIEMIRTDSTTWVKGPEQYWKDFQLPADLVKKAGSGKFVVLTGEAGKRVAQQFDFSNFMLVLASETQTIPTSLLPPVAGVDSTSKQYVVVANKTTNVVTINAAGDITAVSFVDPGKVETVVPISYLQGTPVIAPPSVDQIVTFPMSTPSNSK